MACEVFISYAHKDKRLLERLAVHLKSLEHQELIATWYDGEITPGAEWNKQILDHLNAAQFIILLISPDFIASQFCYSIEMQQAIARHENQQACVIPIILRPTYWEQTPFAKLQALPTEGKPISTWRSQDEAWKNVVQGIQKAILEREKNAAISTLSASTVDELCEQYCRKLFDQWKTLDFKGIQYSDANNLVSIPFLDVFILPDVLVGLPQYETLEREETEEISLLGKETHEKKGETGKHLIGKSTSKLTSGKQVVLQRESLHTVISQHRQLVILGDPGSGKSALLKYLLLTLAEGSDLFHKAFPQPPTATQVVCPVYIPLSIYAETWPTHSIEGRSLKHFLFKHLETIYLGSFSTLLQELLNQGKLLILLDGLDEIPDASIRMQIVRQIEIFTQSYAQNFFIVTSRIVGYRNAPLTGHYQTFTLADFNEEQIQAFTKKWCPAYERWVNHVEDLQLLQEAATKEAQKLFQATRLNEGVRRLAVNPLLLTILALIQRQGIELPSHRVELYDLCVTTLLETWLRTKGSTNTAKFSKNDLIKILRPLAFWMHEKHSTIGTVQENELIEQVVKQLLERKIAQSVNEAEQYAEKFLQTVREKIGILVERGKKRYGFLHLTFEEFFAAWDLVVRRKERKGFIKKHLHDARWQVVISLTLGIIGILQSNEDEVTELLEEAILSADSPFEKWIHRDLIFAGLCLTDDIGVSVDCENAIIDRIIFMYLMSQYNTLRTSITPVFNAWSATPLAAKAIHRLLGLLHQQTRFLEQDVLQNQPIPNISRLERDMAHYTQQLLGQNEDSKVRLFQINALIGLSFLTDVTNKIQDIIDTLSDSDWQVRQSSATALGHLGQDQPDAINALLTLLSDSNVYVRRDAVTALGKVGQGQPQVIDALLPLLSVSNSDICRDAATALGQVGQGQPQVIDALLPLLSATDWQVRQAAATALGQVGQGQPQVIDALLPLLSASNSDICRDAATALGQVGQGQPQVIDALLPLLSATDWQVRQAAATALGQVGQGQPQVIDALLPLLSDPSFSVRRNAATALGQVGQGQPQVIDVLLPLLSDFEPDICETAATALGKVGQDQPHVIDTLLPLLSDSEWYVRQAAATALGKVGQDQPQVINALLPLLSDSNSQVRRDAATALGEVGQNQPQVIDALLPLLSDSEWYVRQDAATALGKVGQGQPQVINALLPLLSDSNWYVRQPTATALGEVGQNQPQVIDTLLPLLADSDWQVRQAAADALGKVGQSQPHVTDALLPLLADFDWQVRQAAATALGKIGQSQPDVVKTIMQVSTNSSSILLLEKRNIDRIATTIHKQISLRIISLLGSIGQSQPQVIDALLLLLSDSSSDIRDAAVTALGKVGQDQPQVIDALLHLLSDSSSDIRDAAVTALEQVGQDQPQVIDALLSLLSDPSWFVRWSTASALAKVRQSQPQVIDALLFLLSDSAPDVRQTAITALEDIGQGQPQTIDDPLSLLSDPSWYVRQAAATALGKIGQGQPQTIDALLSLLSDSSCDVRRAAATSLGEIGQGQPQVIDALLSLLSDSYPSVRRAAATSLGKVGQDQPQVIDALLSLLSATDWYVRQFAASALRLVGQGQSRVIDALLPLLSDSNVIVQGAVANALGYLSSNHMAGKRIEELLLKYEFLAERQVTADRLVDDLLSALQKIVG